MKITLITVVGDTIDILQQMLSHYSVLGVDEMILHAHAPTCSDPIIDRIKEIATSSETKVASINVGPWIASSTMNSLLYSLSRSPTDGWFVLADQDEMQVYPDDLRCVLRYCDDHGYTFIEGCLVDRVAESGKLEALLETESVWDRFPMGTMHSGKLLGAVTNKIVAVKGNVRVGVGQHRAYSGVGCPVSTTYVPVHHFKWTSGLLKRLERRLATNCLFVDPTKDLHSRECERFLAYYSQNDRIRLEDKLLMAGRCAPTYPFWNTVRDWRLAAHCFSPDLAFGFHAP